MAYETEDARDNPEWDDTNSRPIDTAAKLAFVRVLLGMPQGVFADLLGIPVSTLQNWEQRRTEPEALARTFIDLLFDDPEGMRDRLSRRRAA